ncbi:MAG: c-type cytochrome [Candidatus Acidiferrales bacterium]
MEKKRNSVGKVRDQPLQRLFTIRKLEICFSIALLVGITGGVGILSAKTGAGPSAGAAEQKQAGSADVAHGKKVYDARCEICHFSGNTKKKIGPGLKGLAARGKYADGKKVDDESLRMWIEKGGKDMPGYKGVLKEDEVRDLIAYLKIL